MNKLSIKDPQKVIKIDDTIVGLREVSWLDVTVGVARWSTYMKMRSYDQVLTKEHVEKRKFRG